MCKFLICIIISASISWSCDLNHDWKVIKLNSYRDLSAAALHRMLENTMIQYGGKVLVIDVKDLYGLKGKINQTGESIGDTYRTTQEIIDFEARLMSGIFTIDACYTLQNIGTPLFVQGLDKTKRQAD